MINLKEKKGFLCDMDGVIYHGERLLPGVKEFVEWMVSNDKKFLFLTNASSRSPKELQMRLARMGLDIDESHFYTSAMATAQFLNTQSPGCSAYVVGDPGLYNALYEKGITTNDVNPDYVVIGETVNYNFDTITKAMRHVMNGARLIGTNTDLMLLVRQLEPTSEGLPLQFYFFTKAKDWISHEKTAADVIEHMVAVMPQFGLRIYQRPSGLDIRKNEVSA